MTSLSHLITLTAEVSIALQTLALYGVLVGLTAGAALPHRTFVMIQTALDFARDLGDVLVHFVNGVIFTVLKLAAAVFAVNGIRFPIVAPADRVSVDLIVAHGRCCFGGCDCGVGFTCLG